MSIVPVRMGCVGIGGFGREANELMLRCRDENPEAFEFVAVCDNDLSEHAAWVNDLRSQGVGVCESYDALLETDINAVWLPLPIHLHQSFTERALAAGKAVLCEKPAAGTIDEVDAMIRARDRAGLPVLIGFQDIFLHSTAQLKRRILDGEIGNINHVTVHACWPRGDSYYNRNLWAGALKQDDRWVLDSPANNALSHFICLSQFLTGPELNQSATPIAVEAELYRARQIESFDTCCLRIVCEEGFCIYVYLTHACGSNVSPVITIHGDKGCVVRSDEKILITPAGGKTEEWSTDWDRLAVLQGFNAFVGRQDDAQAVVVPSLEVARCHLLVVNGAMEACPIADVAVDQLYRPVEGGPVAIRGIEKLFVDIAAKGQTIHESGLANWSRPSHRADLQDYAHFQGPLSYA